MPKVFVWKSTWLPASETFIRNQTGALTRWQYTCFGLEKVESTISRPTDVILGSGRKSDLIRRKSLVFLGRHRAVREYLATEQPDLLHIHFAAEARGIDRIARKLQIPYVITVHGNDVTEAPARPGIRGLVYRRQARRALRGAERVIAVSDFIASKVKELDTQSSNVVTHNIGIEIPLLVDKARTAYDILFVGRLVAVKGVSHLLDAARIIVTSGRTVRIGIAGTGPELDNLKELAIRYNLNVDFMGMVDAHRVRELMSESSVFVAPSVATPSGQTEGFGMVFLEAAAQQLPVASYANGGIPEAVLDGTTGLLAPAGDTHMLARNILELLEDSELRDRMGRAGRKRVMQDFDVAKQTETLEALYDSCLQDS